MNSLITPSSLLPSLHQHQRLLVALSGGLDSTVLLHLLCQLRDSHGIQVRALYVHHGLSQYADDWLSHCQTLCHDWHVPFVACRVQLAAGGKGIEAAAREARYNALRDNLLPGEALVTAQHQDDQCETLLLALKRGSGPAGLAAMPARLRFGDSEILRPLLGFTRAELEDWARAHSLIWIEDDSNGDDSYDRNFLRLRILPLLRERWPTFSRSVARSAQLCGEQEGLLDELLAEQLTALTGPDGELRLTALMSASDARRGALLRRWLAFHGAPMPSRDALQRLWQEVALSREDSAPRLRLGDHDVRRFQDALWWVPIHISQRERVLAWDNPLEPLTLPDDLGTLYFGDQGQRVRPPLPGEKVSIRFQASGMIHIVGRHRGRPMKKLWQELGVPSWRRHTTPLLFYGEQLIAASGVFITREGQAVEDESWYLVWQKMA